MSRRIGLMGPFGSGNLGDAAIQEAMIGNARARLAGVEIVGFSLNPRDTQARHGIPAHPLNAAVPRFSAPEAAAPAAQRPGNTAVTSGKLWRSLAALKRRLNLRIPHLYGLRRQAAFWSDSLSALRGLDALIVSGGGQLDDIWDGPWGQPLTLLQWALMARLARVRFLFVSVGAGPIRTRPGRSLIRAALKLASYRSFRDTESLELIRGLGFSGPARVFPDLAFSLPRARTGPEAGAPGGKPRVGVSPMAYAHVDKWPDKDADLYGRYIRELAAFAAGLIEEGYRVILFRTHVRMDAPAIADFKAALGPAAARLEDRSGAMDTVSDLLSALAAMDLVVTSRFHGVVLSLLLAKPVLAVTHHPKIDALMAQVGQSEFCLSIDAFAAQGLRARFQALERERAETARRLEGEADRFRAALELQYAEIFSGAAA